MTEVVDKNDEIQEGFKIVQLGPKQYEVPIDWETLQLGDVAEMHKGRSPMPKSDDSLFGGDIPYVKIKEISNSSKLIFNTEESVTKKGAEKSRTFPKDTLIIGIYGASRGGISILDISACSHEGVVGIFDLDNSVYKEFLYYYLIYEDLNDMGHGAAQKNLNIGILESVYILLPPLPEQRYIADILSTVDEQIQQTAKVISKTEELKQGLSRDLVLGQGLAEDYKQARLGSKTVQIPSDWEMKTFSDVATVEKGNTPKTSNDDYYGGSIVWVTPDDLSTLYERSEKYISDSRRKLTDAGLESTSVNIVPAPSVVFTSRSYGIGKTAICTVPAASNQGIIAFHCEDKLGEEYLYYYLNYIMDYIIALSGVSTFPEVSLTDVRNLRVPVPTEEDQKQIEDVLTSVDDKLVQERERKENLQELKRGLMQNLLTGTKRVDPELSD